jgi:hypothetical protein|tara:strand:+ start:2151 stop:2387 length:237 start_codon:yes stop_codon:yes gene_type:complete
MALPTVDGRKVWLDESQLHALSFLSRMVEIEDKRTLSEAEAKFKAIAASYLYLYNKAQEAGLLEDEDAILEFLNETIH